MAGCGMAFRAATYAFEIRLSLFGIACKELFHRIGNWNSRRFECFLRTSVKVCGDVGNLFRRCRKGRHALVWPAILDNLFNQIAFHVMSNERGPNQIRSASAGRIRAMAKGAGLTELLLAAFR